MGEYAGLVRIFNTALHICFTLIFFKFAFNSLVPGNALKMIEEAAISDPVQLQQGFEAYDNCSSISIHTENTMAIFGFNS